MNSIWSDKTALTTFPQLNRSIKTDVLIIGGGITGILCAYMMRHNKVDYTLVEADTICSGVTKNTTAKITSQHGLIYDKLIRRFGIEKAGMYLKANNAALDKYRDMCRDIDCDFEIKSNIVYSLSNRKKIEGEIKALEELGYKAEFCEELPLPFKIAGAVKFNQQAQFNPLKFISAIAKELNIYEHTAVREINDNKAVTDFGEIAADRIIVATHFPFINKHGSYFVKMYQHRSYVLALDNAPKYDGMYVDEASKGFSFRNYGEFLLLGGGGHRTGKNGGKWDELSDFAHRYYPGAKEKYRWATQDCMTLDDIAYIGNYSKRTPYLYTATGYNKWGMTSSMAAAMILSDIIIRGTSQYTDLFSPSRTIIRPQLALNGFESITNLLSIKTPRCSHLGCALKWNPQEHTWDCPCHGSRYTRGGKLLENPAMKNINTE